MTAVLAGGVILATRKAAVAPRLRTIIGEKP